ncbi:MAG: DNA-3-methyladenine glycosylase I [Candidatus Dormibacteria bacterium]
MESSGLVRCPWAWGELLTAYHDREWGVPATTDRDHLELLCLEGAQAGLSWLTVLRRRDRYRSQMLGFDPRRLAALPDFEVERWLSDPGLIRNRAKLQSVLDNARALVRLTPEWGSFSNYLAQGIGLAPQRNRWLHQGEVPAETDASRELSRELRRRGFHFVGPTICYAYMQSAGLVNDHLVGCFRWTELVEPPGSPAPTPAG